MTRCPQKPMGCDCGPFECRSLAVRLDAHRKRYDRAVIDWQNAWFRAVSWTVTTACMAVLLALAAVSAESQTKQQDLRMQEVMHHGQK